MKTLFTGIEKSSGNWVKGDIVRASYIMDKDKNEFEVIPSTIRLVEEEEIEKRNFKNNNNKRQ